MTDVLEGSPDELIQSIEREQKSLVSFLAERAELTDDDRATLKAHNDTLRDLRDLASSTEALGKFRDIAKQATEAKDAESEALKAKAVKSLTEQIWDDPAQQAYLKSAVAPGRESEPFKVQGVAALLGRKSLVNTTNVGEGNELLRTAPREFLEMLWRPRTVLDLVRKGTSDFDSVEWVETIFTNNAAAVEEATALTGTSGTKPDSENAMAVRRVDAVTIAHLKYATDKALRNRGEVAAIIENELSKGLDEFADQAMITDDGIAPNMRGVLATSGTQAQAFTVDVLTTLVKARTKVRLARSAVTPTVLMNPIDYEDFLLTPRPGGGYLFEAALFGTGTPNLLGMSFIQSEVVPAGAAIVADWSSALLQTVDAERIAWTDSHSDFFKRNIRACRAEVDLLFRIQRPAQFVVADLA